MAASEARQQFDDRITAMETSFLAKLDAGFANIEAMLGGLHDDRSGIGAGLTSCRSKLISYDRQLVTMKVSLDKLAWMMIANNALLVVMLTAVVAANFYH